MSKRPLTNGAGSSDKKSAPLKIDAGYVIKSAACILLFFAAAAFFSYVCRQLSNDYLLFLTPTAAATVSWLISLGLSVLFSVIMAGIVVVLVRPYWLVIATFLVSAVLYPLIVGPSMAAWIAAGVFVALMCLFLLYVAKQLKNQINFSAHPLSDMKLLLLSLLAIQVCVAFGIGYAQDSARRNYIIPPEIKAQITGGLMSQATGMINSQKATAAQKKTALDEAGKKAQTATDDIEKQLQSVKTYMPIALGVLLFFVLQTIFLILGFVPILCVKLLFFLLRITRFANVKVETKEVKHLTLEPVPLASGKPNK